MTASKTAPVVAIDGPSGSGKGTLASMLARELGWHLLDSGAIYRIVALAALQARCDLNDAGALQQLVAELAIRFEAAEPGKTTRIWLNEQEVTDRIRTEEVGAAASKVAAVPAVRAALLELQRGFQKAPGLVADGRDMGTVVFPDAPVKIYLTASAEERAQRRFKQLQEKGESVSLPALLAEIQARDERDMNRSIAPLKPAEDALQLDSTELSIDEVFASVLEKVRQLG